MYTILRPIVVETINLNYKKFFSFRFVWILSLMYCSNCSISKHTVRTHYGSWLELTKSRDCLACAIIIPLRDLLTYDWESTCNPELLMDYERNFLTTDWFGLLIFIILLSNDFNCIFLSWLSHTHIPFGHMLRRMVSD